MKTRYSDYSLDEIPELEETEFEFSVPSCRRIEDANDIGHLCDSISIAMDASSEFQMFS